MTDKQLDTLLKSALSENETPCESLKLQLKEALKGENTMTRKTKILIAFKCAAVAAVLAVSCVTALANSSYEIASAMSKIPVIGALTKVVTFRTYEDEKNNFSAYVKVPEIENAGRVTNELNKQIREYTDSIIKQYEADKAAVGDNEAEGLTARHNLTTGYTTVTDTEDYFSIKVWTTVVMGGSNSYDKYFTVDKKHGEIVTLDTLFEKNYDYKTAIYNEIIKQMKERMAASDVVHYFLEAEDGWGYTEFTGEENYYINALGNLVISFNKYDVAPGAMGIQEFSVGSIKNGRLAPAKTISEDAGKISGIIEDATADTFTLKTKDGKTYSFNFENTVTETAGMDIYPGCTVSVYCTDSPDSADAAKSVKLLKLEKIPQY